MVEPSAGEPVLEGEAPGVHRLWRWHNVLVIAWRDHPDAQAVSKLASTSEDILARGQYAKLSYIHLVRSRIQLPGADVRAALLQTTSQLNGRMACVGVVIGGAGFWTSAMRSFATGIHFLIARDIEMQINGSIVELEGWFCSAHQAKTGVALDPKELTGLLEGIRTRDELVLG